MVASRGVEVERN